MFSNHSILPSIPRRRNSGILQGVRHEQTITDNVLPSNFPPLTSSAILNVELIADLDVSSYNPTGLLPGAVVRIRKTDMNKTFRIIYTEAPITYKYLNIPGEVLTLEWYPGTGFRII